MSEFSARPFVAGSLVGMRSFTVDPQGRLRGVTYPLIWRPGENQAKCRCEGVAIEQDRVATRTHGCGFYAYTNGDLGYTDNGANPSGIIEGWGTVTVGSRGFRAAKSRILALVLPITPQTLAAAALGETDPEDRFERVMSNYPDVPFFRTIEDALRDFPMTEPPEPTPDEDAFWDDEFNPPPRRNGVWTTIGGLGSFTLSQGSYARGGFVGGPFA